MKKSAKEDLRIKRTYMALYNAMFSMLGRRNFNDITVNDLCLEALISRTTFYAHFCDKYDLLKYLLSEVRSSIIKDVYNYEELKENVNQFIFSNKKIITNLIRDANSETLMIMREFMSSIVELIFKRKVRNATSPNHIILFTFCAGGLVNLLTWIVENNFPPDISMMNTYIYKMLQAMTIWDAEQEQAEIN